MCSSVLRRVKDTLVMVGGKLKVAPTSCNKRNRNNSVFKVHDRSHRKRLERKSITVHNGSGGVGGWGGGGVGWGGGEGYTGDGRRITHHWEGLRLLPHCLRSTCRTLASLPCLILCSRSCLNVLLNPAVWLRLHFHQQLACRQAKEGPGDNATS